VFALGINDHVLWCDLHSRLIGTLAFDDLVSCPLVDPSRPGRTVSEAAPTSRPSGRREEALAMVLAVIT